MASKSISFRKEASSTTLSYRITQSSCESTILSNLGYRVSPTSATSWLDVTLNKTSSNKTMVLSVCKNVNTTPRIANVIITLDGNDCGADTKVTVSQGASPVNKCYGINVPLTVTSEAQTVQQIRLAVLSVVAL